MRRSINLLVWIILALSLLTFSPDDAACAEKRVALVIGNGAYQSVPTLANPIRDAKAVAAMLGKAGFASVWVRYDVGNLDFKRALRDFLEVAKTSDIAVVFYAGHAIQIADQNYMLPVDAKLAREHDARDEAISLERIVEAIQPAGRLRLVILDACRDNPFLSKMQRRVATRQIAPSGLASVEPTMTDTLIAYAAKAGSTADDGDGEHSPFTMALLKHLAEPGLDIRLAFGRVRDEVRKSTRNEQEPFVYGSLGGTIVSLVPAPAVQKPAALADLKGDYELVERINTKGAWEVFVNTHKSGYYVELAKERVRILDAQPPVPESADQKGVRVAALPPPSAPAKSTAEEDMAWDRVRDSTDATAIRKFIERYKSSPHAVAAQDRLEGLEKAAEAERLAEEKAEAKRLSEERAAAEERLRKAEETRKLVEAKRLAEERAAAEAEQARKAEEARKLAEAKRLAEEKAAAEAKRLSEERAAAEERLRKAEEIRKAEETRKLVEAKRLAEERAAAEAERLRKAEAKRLAEEKAAAEAERLKTADEAKKQAEGKRLAEEKAAAEAKRLSEERAAAEERLRKAEEIRKTEETRKLVEAKRLAEERAAAEAKRLAEEKAVAEAERARKAEEARKQAEAKKLAEAEQAREADGARKQAEARVRTVQLELRRLGCFSGREDGTMNQATKDAIQLYHSKLERQPVKLDITDDFLSELKRQARVCPVVCPQGQAPDGDHCVVAKAKPEKSKAAERRPAKEERRQASKPQRQPAARNEAPPSRQREARPVLRSGGGASTMTGVGF
jgi:caspase domain-containing protein